MRQTDDNTTFVKGIGCHQPLVSDIFKQMAPLRNFGAPQGKVEAVGTVILSTSKDAYKDTSVSPTKDSGTPSVRRKYEMCKNWKEKGSCRYGDKCLFAHGEHELTRKKSSDTSDTKEEGKISDVSKTIKDP